MVKIFYKKRGDYDKYRDITVDLESHPIGKIAKERLVWFPCQNNNKVKLFMVIKPSTIIESDLNIVDDKMNQYDLMFFDSEAKWVLFKGMPIPEKKFDFTGWTEYVITHLEPIPHVIEDMPTMFHNIMDSLSLRVTDRFGHNNWYILLQDKIWYDRDDSRLTFDMDYALSKRTATGELILDEASITPQLTFVSESWEAYKNMINEVVKFPEQGVEIHIRHGAYCKFRDVDNENHDTFNYLDDKTQETDALVSFYFKGFEFMYTVKEYIKTHFIPGIYMDILPDVLHCGDNGINEYHIVSLLEDAYIISSGIAKIFEND
jgi:hypothetical protein